MATGATLNGRALAQTGQVSMDTNTLTGPTCEAAAAAASESSSSNNASANSVPPCIASEVTTIPVIINSKRVDPTSILINWGPYAGIDTFSVRYGLANGTWLYNTNVTGFSITINDLPPSQPIWIQVAARNNCSIGTYGEAKLVGAPSLPDTGLAPHKNILQQYILNGIATLSSFVLKLIQL